nr:hypothetical protein [Nostoc flagelliforme]
MVLNAIAFATFCLPAQKRTAREFWLGTKRLPPNLDVATGNSVSGILIKKQGDFPDFWHKDTSFFGSWITATALMVNRLGIQIACFKLTTEIINADIALFHQKFASQSCQQTVPEDYQAMEYSREL